MLSQHTPVTYHVHLKQRLIVNSAATAVLSVESFVKEGKPNETIIACISVSLAASALHC